MMGTDLSQATYDKYASAVENSLIKDMGPLPPIFTPSECRELYDGGYMWIDMQGNPRIIIDV